LIDGFLHFIEANGQPDAFEFYRDKLATVRERFGTRPTAGAGAFTDADVLRY
jgi:hypothetical protein